MWVHWLSKPAKSFIATAPAFEFTHLPIKNRSMFVTLNGHILKLFQRVWMSRLGQYLSLSSSTPAIELYAEKEQPSSSAQRLSILRRLLTWNSKCFMPLVSPTVRLSFLKKHVQHKKSEPFLGSRAFCMNFDKTLISLIGL